MISQGLLSVVILGSDNYRNEPRTQKHYSKTLLKNEITKKPTISRGLYFCGDTRFR